MNATDAFIAFKAQRIDVRQFADIVLPILQRVAKVVARRQKVDPDDLTSELWILTQTRLVYSYDPSATAGLESFLIGCAIRISSSNGVRSLRSPSDEICASDMPSINELPDQDYFESLIDPYSDMAFADKFRQGKLNEIQLRLSLCNNKKNSPTSDHTEVTKKDIGEMKKTAVPGTKLVIKTDAELNEVQLPIPPRRTKSAQLTPDQEELVNIRKKLGYSQESFAHALNIGVACLSSYEYGRTASVNKATLIAARNLLSEIGSCDGSEFDNLQMSEILARWAKELGISYDEDITLAKVLTVSAATISRWKNNKTRPPLIGKPGKPGVPGRLGLKQLNELVRRYAETSD